MWYREDTEKWAQMHASYDFLNVPILPTEKKSL